MGKPDVFDHCRIEGFPGHSINDQQPEVADKLKIPTYLKL